VFASIKIIRHSQFPIYCHCISLFYFWYSWKQQTAHTTVFNVNFRKGLSSCWWNFQTASFQELWKQMESMAITLSSILHKTPSEASAMPICFIYIMTVMHHMKLKRCFNSSTTSPCHIIWHINPDSEICNITKRKGALSLEMKIFLNIKNNVEGYKLQIGTLINQMARLPIIA